MKELAHNHGDTAGFLRKYDVCFATRADGSSWSNWETTWRRGAQYFRDLIRPGGNKSVAGIASMVDVKQEKLERFVRERASTKTPRSNSDKRCPRRLREPPLCLFLTGWESPNKDTTVSVLAINGAAQPGKCITAK